MRLGTLRWRWVAKVLAGSCLLLGSVKSLQGAENPRAERPSKAFASWFEPQQASLVSLYKTFHQNPELSFQETKTAARVAEELKKAGATVTVGVGRIGVVGILKNGEGPTLLIRSDLDGLPVTEETKLDYSSQAKGLTPDGKTVGVMHACGHDIHMTCLVGIARWLSENRKAWSGTVVLVGQPAEELVSGAKAMLKDGLYQKFPKPQFAIALHVTNDQPVGTVVYTSGPAFASSTSIDLTIKGKGGHGAAPHLTVDPIVLAALIIVDLQTISSRDIDPIQPCVLTVGSIQGGTKHNIIPDEVKLQLTLRSYNETVREQMIDGIKRRIQGLASAHKAPDPIFAIVAETPPTVNTPALVDRVVPAIQRELGNDKVQAVPALMGAEDFGLFSEGMVPTFMFRIGTIDVARFGPYLQGKTSLPSLHSSTFYPDPADSIRTGIRAMSAAVHELLPASSASNSSLE